MQKLVIIGLLTFFCIGIGFSQDNVQQQFKKNGEIYFLFEIESKKEIPQITKIVSIDNVKGNIVYAYANEKEYSAFLKTGLEYTLLPHPNEGFDPPMANFDQIKNAKTWSAYPTYEAYVAMMYQFEADYPELCDVDSIGQSVDGRAILVAKISDSVGTDQNEPEFFYTSSMHGDELAGFPLMLNLIDSLLSGYGTVARITNLVDNIEIYINPLANPDGTYTNDNSTVAGATRYNANGYDLNRNFPDVINGLHPNTQTETYHFMNFAESRDFVMSANFHGGAEVCNYPWDHKYELSADDDWWQYISHEYADTAQQFSPGTYMDGFDDGITNGAAWYVIDGGRQDYMNYFHQCREETFEISQIKNIDPTEIANHWEYNRRSLLNYMEQCLFGIRGIITDANTGLPIEAEVFIVGHEADSSWVYSSLPVGNYHRLLIAGTYDVQISAPCYETQVIQNVVVQNKNTTILDVQLQPAADAVDFTVNSTTFTLGEAANFTDLSCGNPTTWQWIFEGGIPSSSTQQNPSGIVYNNAGIYTVKLVISNGSALDSITKVDYITVNEEYLITNGSFTTCSGIFYDSGGESNDYIDDEDYEMSFFPSSVNGKMKVEFTQFDLEYQSSCSYDWLRIYDGPNELSPLIGTFCGTDSPGIIVSTHESGALTFVFHSDYSITASGWEADLSCNFLLIELDIRVLLEGPFNGLEMNTDLNNNGLIPLAQPYNVMPWNYTGTETVAAIPNPEVVDWILVELRDAASAPSATVTTVIERQAAFILKDGSVVGTDGFSNLVFNNSIVNQLFIVVWHRNHLGIMSTISPAESGGIYSYDFSSGSTQAYGTESQISLSGGKYGMFAGDANADGVISDSDGTDFWYSETGQSGYLGSDVNLNSQSNNKDKNDFWYINYSESSKVPE